MVVHASRLSLSFHGKEGELFWLASLNPATLNCHQNHCQHHVERREGEPVIREGNFCL